MPWTQKQMLRDANGDLIPQYWDVAEQEFKPLTGSDGANDVRLTGSNVEEIIPRGIRTERQVVNYELPGNIKGAYFYARVFGITGGNPSLQVRTYLRHPSLITFAVLKGERITSSSRKELHIWHPGTELSDAEPEAGTNIKIANVRPSPQIQVDVRIDGEFSDDEGIDFAIHVVTFV